jgi:hypothetical protein
VALAELLGVFPPTKFLFDRWAACVRRPDGGLKAP